MWHAKALHTSSTFLPSDCPLVSHVLSSYIKHHLNPKIEERRSKHESIVSITASIPSKGSNHTMIYPAKDDEVDVPDERKNDDFNKLRLFFKGHKISDTNFGDPLTTKNIKSCKKSLNISMDKSGKKRHRKPVNYIDNKSYKGTPKKVIDFAAYLSGNKKTSSTSTKKTIKKGDRVKRHKKGLNSRNNHIASKNEVSKSNTSLR